MHLVCNTVDTNISHPIIKGRFELLKWSSPQIHSFNFESNFSHITCSFLPFMSLFLSFPVPVISQTLNQPASTSTNQSSCCYRILNVSLYCLSVQTMHSPPAHLTSYSSSALPESLLHGGYHILHLSTTDHQRGISFYWRHISHLFGNCFHQTLGNTTDQQKYRHVF